MQGKIIPFPGPPRVRIGPCVYEVVAPATLREMIDDIAEHIYAQTQLSAEQRDAWFARTVAAAAINAMTELDLQRTAPPRTASQE